MGGIRDVGSGGWGKCVGSVIYIVGWDSINLRHLLGFSALWLFELGVHC